MVLHVRRKISLCALAAPNLEKITTYERAGMDNSWKRRRGGGGGGGVPKLGHLLIGLYLGSY